MKQKQTKLKAEVDISTITEISTKKTDKSYEQRHRRLEQHCNTVMFLQRLPQALTPVQSTPPNNSKIHILLKFSWNIPQGNPYVRKQNKSR